MMETKIEGTDKIAKGYLYALLSVCTQEDLDPLVTYITKKRLNRLTTNEDYKRYKPDHTKYYKLIADEIRRFGGHSFNLTRGLDRLSYDEVVLDVCKKLDIPCSKGKTVENENNLLTIFLDQQWKALSEDEKEKLIKKARADALKNNAKDIILGSKGLLLSRLSRGPIGWLGPIDQGMTIFKIADAAFSVTVPCVLHIAYLRKKYLGECASGSVAESRFRHNAWNFVSGSFECTCY